MTDIIFFQKPGCGTNARQKLALEQAGHSIEARDLLREGWTTERLRGFFGDLPVTSWFNPAALKIKSGEIDPAQLDAATALGLLVAEPLLIRRPLIEAGDKRCAGFDNDVVAGLLGDGNAGVGENCSRPNQTPCPSPATATGAGP
ncbi:MAG: ArsC/Spx/MgsR family protein [Methylovirgula sp.]